MFPGLDGIRGSAILLVLLCHHAAFRPRTSRLAGVLQIGWVGVDQFFVLSGFLITGVLFDAKGTGHFFRNFYARRILRIFPLYYAFLFSLVVILFFRFMAGLFMGPAAPGSGEGVSLLWRAQPWLWTYTANIWVGVQSRWSPWTDIIMPLWSLSVEEQFYLVWPLVVCFCSQRALIRICLGVLAGALVARLALNAAGIHWFILYTFTATRADSLAAGALVALLLRLPNGQALARRWGSVAGASAFLLLVLLSPGLDPVHHPWLRSFFYTPLALFFAALVLFALDSGFLWGMPKRFYENPLLRSIGNYSYGMYILHLPLMYLTEYAAGRVGFYDLARGSWPLSLGMIAISLSLTAGLAIVSFHCFEKRFLKLKSRFRARPVNADTH